MIATAAADRAVLERLRPRHRCVVQRAAARLRQQSPRDAVPASCRCRELERDSRPGSSSNRLAQSSATPRREGSSVRLNASLLRSIPAAAAGRSKRSVLPSALGRAVAEQRQDLGRHRRSRARRARPVGLGAAPRRGLRRAGVVLVVGLHLEWRADDPFVGRRDRRYRCSR